LDNGWLAKETNALEEWAEFQERFGEIQLLTGAHPDLAMFCKDEPGDEHTEIYIHGPHLELLERFSPGGWENSEKPTGPGVALLVGRDDPWERLGIEKRPYD
jgi:hypothetical protein